MRLNYDEISPITGNKSVIVEYDSTKNQNTKICMESGYQTFDSWKEGSDTVETFLSASPELVQSTKIVDENSNVWVKVIMMTQEVVLYPDLIQMGELLDVVWKVSTFKYVEDETMIGPVMIVVKVGDKFKVLDEETCSIFEEFDFENAISEFYKRVSKTTEQ